MDDFDSFDSVEEEVSVSNYSSSSSKKGGNSDTYCILALVMGILGIIGGLIPIVRYFTLICAILGIVFGVIGRKASFRETHRYNGMATTGLVLGIISCAFTVIAIIVTIIAGAALIGSIWEYL